MSGERTRPVATTPYTYGRFIGRVGGLAVALGIGAAIANSPGIALADDSQSAASGASSANTGSTDSGPAAGAKSVERPGPSPSGATSDPVESLDESNTSSISSGSTSAEDSQRSDSTVRPPTDSGTEKPRSSAEDGNDTSPSSARRSDTSDRLRSGVMSHIDATSAEASTSTIVSEPAPKSGTTDNRT